MVNNMSKYEKLWTYIQKTNKDTYCLSFLEIKDILGFSLDHSFLKYKKELNSYGFVVTKISMKEKIVYINRINI